MKTLHIAATLLLLSLILLALPALSEPGRVSTPGGRVNMRQEPADKAKLAGTVPNRTLVEVLETGEEWCKITYKQTTAYIKTEFLLLPSSLPGRSVYPDEDTVLLYREPSETALCGAVSPWEAATVLEADGDWLRVQIGDDTGWAKAENYTWQRETPKGNCPWLRERGVLVADTAIGDTTLPRGTEVTVTVIEDDRCLAGTGDTWDYLPVSSISLTADEDAAVESLKELTSAEALTVAQRNLKNKYKAFADSMAYGLARAENGMYRCAFYTLEDQFAWTALVDGKGKVIFRADYSAFSKPVVFADLLPEGQIEIELSADSLAVGDILDCTVSAWTTEQIVWQLTLNGEALSASEPTQHFAASFRPREAGEYTVTALVTDANERTEQTSAAFTVTEATGEPPLQLLYSQKDGWWADKAYRKSDLDQSGCAIFALSHAMQRLGYTGDELKPETLAKTYALCLTPQGTNNERLITEASKVYNYSTKRYLVSDEKLLAEGLRSGTLYSFAIVQGHIALMDGLSEDGTLVHIVDSAPGATWRRMKNTTIYYEGKGGYRMARSLSEIEGARWYMDTEDWGGLTYWMPLSYAAKRGGRLIQPNAPES